MALAAIFAGSAVNALYIPIAYYWMLHNSMLQAGRVIPQLPAMFRHWRRIEMWWEVVVRLMAYTGTATLNMMIINRLRNSDYHSRQKVTVNIPRSSLVVISGTLSNHHAIIRRTNSANAANKILILNSLFFLTTQSLDFGMSVLVAFSQAPICLFHITNGFIQVYDPFRNFLVNMYFAFGFAFYLCCGENSFTGRILGVSWCRRPSEEPVLRYRGSETKITSLMTTAQNRELHLASSRRSTTTF
ncbi:hypothetical protein RvY_05996 [Ramazzottius varieornatus]|uniref:Uncharacterized protein n=1 Tax=Ramazzottius varieornatus TaxID=947166 RepID=A0A1D1UXH0_RAMVA|nr:hypothetical protein RvY_05996 [Ramazzottius varieornatus]